MSWNIFSIINFDAIAEKIVENNIIDKKDIINSIIEEIIISFFEKPKILKIRFWKVLIYPWTIIALEITTKPTITVTAEIILTAINTLLSTSVTFDK